MKNHEQAESSTLAQDLTSQQPVDPATHRLLKGILGFSEPHLIAHETEHSLLIEGGLDTFEDMLFVTRKLARPDILGGIEQDSAEIVHDANFIETYARIAKNPFRKMQFDSGFVLNWLRKLGPTNQLRANNNLDAGFELSHMLHLLQEDRSKLAEKDQHPEFMYVEGLIMEEMALLWHPTTPGATYPLTRDKKDTSAFAYDLNDTNVFTSTQLEDLSPKDRWRYIGGKAAFDTAYHFEAIVADRRTEPNMRVKAACRAVDMKARGLRIIADTEVGHGWARTFSASEKINSDFLVWLANPANQRGVEDGVLFEAFTVAAERHALLLTQDRDKLIRLALPREDEIHNLIRPYINRKNVKVNLSADAIVEDMNGNFVAGYQTKAMLSGKFEQDQQVREYAVGPLVYPKERMAMRFVDSYQTPINGVQASQLVRSRFVRR